jgi:hypothetical protein
VVQIEVVAVRVDITRGEIKEVEAISHDQGEMVRVTIIQGARVKEIVKEDTDHDAKVKEIVKVGTDQDATMMISVKVTTVVEDMTILAVEIQKVVIDPEEIRIKIIIVMVILPTGNPGVIMTIIGGHEGREKILNSNS